MAPLTLLGLFLILLGVLLLVLPGPGLLLIGGGIACLAYARKHRDSK